MLTKEQIKKRVIRYCSKKEQIIAAYLFGSFSKGRSKSSSDVDIAFLVRSMPEGEDRLAATLDLSDLLNANVDLTFLNTAGEVLKHQVIKYGELLYGSSRGERIRFEVNSMKFYEDFLYLHERYSKGFQMRRNRIDG